MSGKQSFWPDSDQILHVISMEFLSPALEAQTSLAARSEEIQLFSQATS